MATEPVITRENLILALWTPIKKGAPLVLVDGPPGIGVTTLLHQYTASDSQSISLTLRTGSRISYDPRLVILNIVDQLAQRLGETHAPEDPAQASAILPTLLYKLSRKAQYTNFMIRFVVDGLHQIPPTDDALRAEIINLLPFGEPGCQLVVSGSQSTLPAAIFRRLSPAVQSVPGFTLDETLTFLSDWPMERKQLEKLWRDSGCNPSVLSGVRRLLSTGTSAAELQPALTDNPPDFFKWEWQRLELDSTSRSILAVLAHDDSAHSTASLSATMEMAEEDVQGRLTSLRFIEISNGNVTFISPLFKEFVRTQLTRQRGEALERIISAKLSTPDAPDSLASLPYHLAQRKRYADLLEYLSPQRLAASARVLGSATALHRHATEALNAAAQLQRSNDIVQFCLHAALLADVSTAQPFLSHVRALSALGLTSEALALAESAHLLEDRLQLLAAVGRDLCERGHQSDPRLLTLLGDLYDQCDASYFAERSTALAENLLFLIPKLGLDLLDKISRRRQTEERSAWDYAKLSVEATKWTQRKLLPQETLTTIKERISDPEAKLLAACASTTHGAEGGATILKGAESLTELRDKVRLLGSWIVNNSGHQDALAVVSKTLEMITSSAIYAPDATALRRLAAALERPNDIAAAFALVPRFDALTATTSRTGSSDEYVRLQCSLVVAEWSVNRPDATKRLNALLLFIADVEDPGTKAACLASVHSRLNEIDPEGCLNIDESLHTIVADELTRAIDTTLASTADPQIALATTIKRLANSKLDLSIGTVARYNSPERRDLGHVDIFASLAESPSPSVQSMADVQSRIVDTSLKQACEAWLLATLHERSAVNESEKQHIERLVKAECHTALPACIRYQIASKFNIGDAELHGRLRAALQKNWSQMELSHEKLELGYAISSSLASSDAALARQYLERTSLDRESLVFDTAPRARAYSLTVALAVRAFGALLPKGRESEQNLQDIREAIDATPLATQRVRFWTELALRYDMARRQTECTAICDKHIAPALRELSSTDPLRYAGALVEASPALFRAHFELAADQVSQLAQPERDEALESAGWYMLESVPPHDPFSAKPNHAYNITYEVALSVIRLVEMLDSDSAMFGLLTALTDTLCSKRSQRSFTREQRKRLKQKLLDVANSKFPTPGGIEHHGYRIAVSAQARHIEDSDRGDWEALIDLADKIPNKSDSALVISIVASSIPQSFSQLRADTFENAERRIGELPCLLDRYLRLVDLADSFVGSDDARAKRLLQAAARILQSQPSLGRGRRLVDAAYHVDPATAASIAEMIDDDPARTSYRKMLRARVREKEIAATFATEGVAGPLDSSSANSCWIALADLNAGRSAPLSGEHIWRLITGCAMLPLAVSFPILSFAFASAARQYSGTEDSAGKLRSMFDGSIVAARVAGELIGKKAIRVAPASEAGDSHGIIVGPGDRAKATIWLEEWCRTNISQRLIVCDPYFGLEDLSLLMLVLSGAPTAAVTILTSKYALRKVDVPHADTFRKHWRSNVASCQPPESEILSIGAGTQGKSPMHDRWWLAESAGLALGTSYGGLGAKHSEISVLPEGRLEEIRMMILPFLQRKRILHGDERVEYEMFSL